MRKLFLHACFIGFASFLIILIVWRIFEPSAVLFFQGLVVAIAVSVAQFCIQRKVESGVSTAIKDSIITLLVCYSFMFTIPTTVDRSYSVMMIVLLQQRTDGLPASTIEQYFINDFIIDGGVQKRLSEQLAAGSLTKVQDQYQLTPFGSLLAESFLFVQKVFSIRTEKTVDE